MTRDQSAIINNSLEPSASSFNIKNQSLASSKKNLGQMYLPKIEIGVRGSAYHQLNNSASITALDPTTINLNNSTNLQLNKRPV